MNYRALSKKDFHAIITGELTDYAIRMENVLPWGQIPVVGICDGKGRGLASGTHRPRRCVDCSAASGGRDGSVPESGEIAVLRVLDPHEVAPCRNHGPWRRIPL